MTFSHDTYISPFTWRYGSPEMRRIWSEENKRIQMRRVWIALATAQQQAGLVTAAQLADLESQADNIDIPRALEIEQETRHDVMAEIRTYAEQCLIGGGIIHWGATSADVNDNVYGIRIQASLQQLEMRMVELLSVVADKIEMTADLVVMAHTHIQPAEPSTLGYRFAVYGQDLLADFEDLQRMIQRVRGKGFKGAVGTQASYDEILSGTGITAQQMEFVAMDQLGIEAFPISTQTYTRQQDVRVMNVLAGIAGSLHKWAMDFRVLQSPPFGEWAEPFGKHQVGSSAMPFKRNPINTENICSLARHIASLPGIAWDNGSQAILERSLDDSANRRVFMPEGFLAADEIVSRATRVFRDMVIDEKQIGRNLETYGPFAATERVLMALVAQGASRQDGHEWLRELSLEAWQTVREGRPNPLVDLVSSNRELQNYLSQDELSELMQADAHVGTAAARARDMAELIRSTI
ncbi:MAG: adenylosuccinate lyase [Cellvibrionaceae bacterium]|jgi:adenylosuccinate lyase